MAELVAAQEEVGIEGAVCVQPRVYGYDHRFVAARAHGDVAGGERG